MVSATSCNAREQYYSCHYAGQYVHPETVGGHENKLFQWVSTSSGKSGLNAHNAVSAIVRPKAQVCARTAAKAHALRL